MPRQRGGDTAGDGSPKERKLIEPGVKEDFLEEVVIEGRTSKTQPEVWAGVPVEEWLSRGRGYNVVAS